MKILVDKNNTNLSKNTKLHSICISKEVDPGNCYTPFCFTKCLIYNPRCGGFANVYPVNKTTIK